jgi:hypothetical protein
MFGLHEPMIRSGMKGIPKSWEAPRRSHTIP